MAKTVYRVIVEKAAIKEDSESNFVENVRGWLQDKLFEYLRLLHEDYAKSDFFAAVQKMGLEAPEIPTEEEVRKAIQEPKVEDEGFGWNYYVNDEPLYITGTLELLDTGIESPVIGSWASLEQIPGVKVSVQVIQDEDLEKTSI
jgi:hypothetical protein